MLTLIKPSCDWGLKLPVSGILATADTLSLEQPFVASTPRLNDLAPFSRIAFFAYLKIVWISLDSVESKTKIFLQPVD